MPKFEEKSEVILELEDPKILVAEVIRVANEQPNLKFMLLCGTFINPTMSKKGFILCYKMFENYYKNKEVEELENMVK